MGAASSAKPIEGPKTPMELVASLKKFVEATDVNFDDAFCNREDIDALIGGLNVIMEHAKVVRELTPVAEEEAVVADPKAMVKAAKEGDMAVVRKQLKAGVAVDAKVTLSTYIGDKEVTALIKAAQGKQTKMSKFLVTRGADTNAKNKGGSTAMMMAAVNGNTELVGYLHENGAEVNAQNNDGRTALMEAAMQGKTAMAKFLIEELKADKTLKNKDGRTAADIAMENDQPITFAAIDPAAAAKKGEEFEKAMEEAEVVDVISTRFQMAKSEKAKEEASEKDEYGRPTYRSCDPFETAGYVKRYLEGGDKYGDKTPNGVIVFNPNTDNALSMKGDPEASNAIWLLNWRKALVRAKKTGGRMIQVIVQGGLSEMQEAEASMAEDKGVPVVRLDCSEVKGYVELGHFKKMAGWKELMALAPKKA